MKQARKIKLCVVTGARSEYGLAMPLLTSIKKDKTLELQILVTGMHLSPEFGLTYREIEKDGFEISEKVEMLLSSDSEEGIIKSTGIAMIGFADALKRLSPDAVIILGDRFESFAAAISAYFFKIPIFHLHGGETTEGATDEGLRHAITKLSYLHFTATDAYRKRVIQLGEDPSRVFNVGAIGLDNIQNLKLLSKRELEKQLGVSFKTPTILVTYHPVTLEKKSAESQFQDLLTVLETRKDLNIIFTYPNADADGRIIIKLINDFVQTNMVRSKAFSSLGQIRYLSCLQYVDALLGNSSSALIEAPSFALPAVNIGDRQKGRVRAGNVIDCKPDQASINSALEKSLTIAFKKSCSKSKNPYGAGKTAGKIVEIIGKSVKNIDLKKSFYDL